MLDVVLCCVVCSAQVSKELRLVAALIVTRHGHRTSMYSLPTHHHYPPALNCHLGHVQSSHTDRVQAVDFATTMDTLLRRHDSLHPVWRRYGLYPASMSCSAAQLTAAGALQMLRLGLLLRDRGYSELARSGVVVRTSAYSRTVQSAAALLYGLAGQTTKLIEAARVELTRNAYLCVDQPEVSSSSSRNWTCSCSTAHTALAFHHQHNRTRDVDERRLRTEIANVFNVTASRLPWTAAILEVPAVLPPSGSYNLQCRKALSSHLCNTLVCNTSK